MPILKGLMQGSGSALRPGPFWTADTTAALIEITCRIGAR
jgi:hypothetical protein